MKNIDVTDKLELLALSRITHCKDMKNSQDMDTELSNTLAAVNFQSKLAIYPAKAMIIKMMKETNINYLGLPPSKPIDHSTLGITKDMVFGCLIFQKKSKDKYKTQEALKSHVEKAIDTLFDYFKSVNLPVPLPHEKTNLVNWILAANKPNKPKSTLK